MQWGTDPDALSIGRLLETPEDGRLKLYLIWKNSVLASTATGSFSAGGISAVGSGRRKSQSRCCVREEVRNHEGAGGCDSRKNQVDPGRIEGKFLVDLHGQFVRITKKGKVLVRKLVYPDGLYIYTR